MTFCWAFTAISDLQDSYCSLLGQVMFSFGRFQKLRRNILPPFFWIWSVKMKIARSFKTEVPTYQSDTTQLTAISETRRPQETARSGQLYPTGVMTVAQYRQTASNNICVTSKLWTWWRIKEIPIKESQNNLRLLHPTNFKTSGTLHPHPSRWIFSTSLWATPVSGSVRTNAAQYVLHNPLIP